MQPTCLSSILSEKYNQKFLGRIEYGTAGFRTKAEHLEHVLYRMGLLAALRSKAKNAAIGLMITASHNAEHDNGVKLIDPDGEMLAASWEKIATQLANVEETNLISMVESIIAEQHIDTSLSATVLIGRDTRKSSPGLSEAAIAGVSALCGTVLDFKVVTTPQLHYLVAVTNRKRRQNAGKPICDEPTIDGYYSKLSRAFKQIRGIQNNNAEYSSTLKLDAANGVGAIAIKELQNYLEDTITINVYNDGDGILNYMCGADYVKVQQTPPSNIPLTANQRWASIDGDADRVVYFYVDETSKFHLLDGDKIAALIAGYIKELLKDSNLPLHLAVVQTAYANGGSTDYMRKVLGVPVTCVSTGVKHLHNKALEFDIGVYFEANGHGTVTLKQSAKNTVEEAMAKLTDLPEKERTAVVKLAHVMELINPIVGDALCDILLVETILHTRGWDIIEWNGIYQDLPNKQLKVTVEDRNVITTTDAERRCVTPAGLQDEIDKIVMRYNRGRAFVRPSGTEDIVRVYAECEDPMEVMKLAVEVSQLVYTMAGGRGEEPRLTYSKILEI